MTSGKRRSLFWGAVIVFFLVGMYLTLTGLGLAINWRELKLVPTGSVYLRFSEKPESITLNGKERPHSSNWFESGLLFRNLLPETYVVLAKSEKFVPWSKSLLVPAGGVLARNNIRLFPLESTSTLIATSTEGFWVLGDEIILKQTGLLKFRGLELRGKEIASQNFEGDEIIVKDKNNKPFLINLDTPETAINLNLWFSELSGSKLAGTPQKFFFHPFSPKKLFIETDKGIFLADEKKNELEKFSNLKSTAFSLNDSGFAIADTKKLEITKFLFGGNWSASTSAKMADLKLNSNANLISGLDDNEKLWLFKNSTSTPELIDAKTQEYVWSPEGDRLLFLSRNLLHVLYLDKWEEDFQKNIGDKLTLAPEHGGRIHKINWFDNNHLIGLWDDELRVIEVDELLPLNGTLLAKEIKDYKQFGNFLFYLSVNGELRKMELE
jgi:hypothetical protein